MCNKNCIIRSVAPSSLSIFIYIDQITEKRLSDPTFDESAFEYQISLYFIGSSSSIYHFPLQIRNTLSSNGNYFWQEENLLIPIKVTWNYLEVDHSCFAMSYWLIPSAIWVNLYSQTYLFPPPQLWVDTPELNQFNLHFTIYLIGFWKTECLGLPCFSY